jgi:hypothetical protein
VVISRMLQWCIVRNFDEIKLGFLALDYFSYG